jgi:hypothetical protein
LDIRLTVGIVRQMELPFTKCLDWSHYDGMRSGVKGT